MPSPEFLQQANTALRDLIIGLPRIDRAILLDTDFIVKDYPTAIDMESLPPGTLLGLFTSPPPRITLFEQTIKQIGKTAREVLQHEVEHRLGYNHSLQPVKAGCGILTMKSGCG